MKGAVTTYRKNEQAEFLGLRSVHRLSTHNQEARRRHKLMGKRTWYLSGRKGWKTSLKEKERSLLSLVPRSRKGRGCIGARTQGPPSQHTPGGSKGARSEGPPSQHTPRGSKGVRTYGPQSQYTLGGGKDART